MNIRFHHIAVLVVAVALVAAAGAASPAQADSAPISIDEAYRQVKDAEKLMPVPAPLATINVGTFDAATGKFDGLSVETVTINGKPVRIVPHVFENAVNARLVFRIVNSTQSVRLSAGGFTAIALAGRASISIGVGRLHDVRWSLTSGLKVHRDELIIDRPRIIGVGAFTIPALPVAVVTDPPQNPARTNSVVYTRSTSVGTTLGITVKNGTSTSEPAVVPEFSEINIFQQQLKASKTFLELTKNDFAAKVLGTVSDVIGKAQRNITTAKDGQSTTKRTFTFTDTRGCAVDAGVEHLGPGHTDIVPYLRNVRVVWLDDGTQTYLDVLGYQTLECPTIDQLRSGVAAVPAASAAAMIALDPFTGPLGPATPLASDSRYVSQPGIGLLPGIVNTATFSQQLLVENSHVDTSTRVVSDDLGAGLLALVGLAPSQTQQLTSTFSVSNESTTTESTSVSTALTARTLIDGVRTELSVFYDRVFGTIAFRDASL